MVFFATSHLFMFQEETDLELSMGMSKDYEEAIRMVSLSFDYIQNSIFIHLINKTHFFLLCLTHSLLQGSTNVRVGSSIFGARSYPPPPASAASASASA